MNYCIILIQIAGANTRNKYLIMPIIESYHWSPKKLLTFLHFTALCAKSHYWAHAVTTHFRL